MAEVSSRARLRAISVTGLQDQFDYEIVFPEVSENLILIAPNGFGKTALLSLINSGLNLNLEYAARHRFRTLKLEFSDGTSWEFVRKSIGSDLPAELKKEYAYRNRRRLADGWRSDFSQEFVDVIFRDTKGKVKKNKTDLASEIPPVLLAEALERASNTHLIRVGADKFRDITTEQELTPAEAFRKNAERLAFDPRFRRYISPYAARLFDHAEKQYPCVFIETQRLLMRVVSESDPGKSESTEQVARQSSQLAKLLQLTSSNYASRSQDLDRSFPNRLIERTADVSAPDIPVLRNKLRLIEQKRKALTEAGILIETTEPVIPPDDERISQVAQALEIYTEDSTAKLSVFDDIYPKVSTFRELISKKLHPKEVSINKDVGATVRRGEQPIDLVDLSSGEKHEFIMLYKLIFETPLDSVVLIDEPEISLHVVWQLEFMRDLERIQSANRSQAIIATHSPQIFQGVDHLVVDLADQVK